MKHKSWPKTLMYHAVIPAVKGRKCSDFNALYKEALYQQFKLIKRTYNVIHPDEYVERISQRKKIPRKSILITFDDGYQNIIDHVLPIAVDLKIPFLVFFNSANLDKREWLWFSRMKAHHLREKGDWNDYYQNYGDKNITEISTWLNKINAPTIDKASDFENELFDGADIVDIKNAIKTGYLIPGGHSTNHPRLTNETKVDAFNQIQQNKTFLEQKLGRKIDLFAYPESDFDVDIAKMVRDVGYKAAFATSYPKPDFPSDLYDYYIPRIGIYRTNTLYFLLKLLFLKS